MVNAAETKGLLPHCVTAAEWIMLTGQSRKKGSISQFNLVCRHTVPQRTRLTRTKDPRRMIDS
ncbi:MAG: hypothetical protein K0R67_3556 [Paenibacillus sp.]|nr:hypothetical protein [Paenibacillus sp.]